MYEKRRVVLKGINKFWPVALMNSEMIALHTVHYDDQNALSFLEDVWLVRDPQESRAFTLEFVSVIALSPRDNKLCRCLPLFGWSVSVEAVLADHCSPLLSLATIAHSTSRRTRTSRTRS